MSSYFYFSRIRFFLLSLLLINEVYGSLLIYERRLISRLNSLMWFEYLRWKFKLFPPGLWSLNGGEGDVLHILLKEFTFLAVFMFSRIVFFLYFYYLISEACESFSIAVGYSNLISLNECDPGNVGSVDMAVQF